MLVYIVMIFTLPLILNLSSITYTVCRPDVDFGVYHRTPSAGTWAGVSDGIGAAADGVGRGARSGAWKGAKIGALIGTTFGSFFAAAEYWDLSTSGRDPFSGVHFCSNSVKKNTFDSKIVIASAIVGLFILITGIVFCTFIGTTLGAILCGIQDVYGMLCRHTFYDVHILPIGDLLGGEITSIISRRATPLCM